MTSTLCALDSDTKLVGKSVIGELDLAALFLSKLGRRVPLYLLVPRNKRHFTPATTQLLAYHDEARAKTSKKETATRQAELRKAVSPGLIEVIAGDLEGGLIRDAGACLLMQETLLYAEDGTFFCCQLYSLDTVLTFTLALLADKLSTIASLVAPLSTPYKRCFSMDPDPTDPAVHTLDLSWAARLYKLVFQGGHFNSTTKSIDPVPGFEDYSLQFSEAFWDAVKSGGTVVEIATGGGAFVFVELIARLKAGKSAKLEEVKKYFGRSEVKKETAESTAKGSKVLLEALSSL